MWTSIKTIQIPDKLTDAWQAGQVPGAAFLGGGTYLAAIPDPAIHTLIALKKVVPLEISTDGEWLKIGGGVTLESLIRHSWPDSCAAISRAAKMSCPSRNIRNQRTVAGEVANFRQNSELVLLLHALNPTLEIFENGVLTDQPLLEWEGEGIIVNLKIDTESVQNIDFLRFAPIPSAVPFLCVAGARFSDHARILVGGNVSGMHAVEFETTSIGSEEQNLVMEHAEDALLADHFGSVDYKLNLLRTALGRLGETL